ncbi:hypothetical protein [Halosimplex halobium]|uniref:hypothetical protein n=1 Tax=Halosimplex halobium TaxID=3396618 RepID=UPI003F564C31
MDLTTSSISSASIRLLETGGPAGVHFRSAFDNFGHFRYDYAHNARLDSELYGQRWMAETGFSAIKGRFGAPVGRSAWYREFRELVLTAVVYNLEQALRQ